MTAKVNTPSTIRPTVTDLLGTANRVLITGSREWTEFNHAVAMRYCFDMLSPTATIVHGGASGADSMAQYGWATKFNRTTEVHRVDWQRKEDGTYNRAAGYERNDRMVAAGADVALAFIQGDSRGTRHCAAAALAAGIPVIFVTNEKQDDGTVVPTTQLVLPNEPNPYALENTFKPRSTSAFD